MIDREALVSELRALRTRRGLTVGRLEQSPVVLAALDTPSVLDAHAKLIIELEALGQDLHAKALRYAYGLDAEGENLTRRRSDFSELHAEGRHVDTIESWEEKMIDELASRLCAGAVAPSASDERFNVSPLFKLSIQESPTTALFQIDLDESEERQRSMGHGLDVARSLRCAVRTDATDGVRFELASARDVQQVDLFYLGDKHNLDGELIDRWTITTLAHPKPPYSISFLDRSSRIATVYYRLEWKR